MRAFLILVAGLALASCATTSDTGDMASNDAPEAVAPVQAAPAETTTAENQDDPNRMVCRAERVTGQLRRQRICRSAAEWAAIQEMGRDTVSRNQSTGYQESPQ